jgi:hypothetical protein
MELLVYRCSGCGGWTNALRGDFCLYCAGRPFDRPLAAYRPPEPWRPAVYPLNGTLSPVALIGLKDVRGITPTS